MNKNQLHQHAYDWAVDAGASEETARAYADDYAATDWTPPHYTPHSVCFPDFEKRAAANEATTKRPDDAVACDGCSGDGVYYGRGYVENGKFKGKTGECFRCHGKGYQTPKDVKRNRYYDNHVRRVEV